MHHSGVAEELKKLMDANDPMKKDISLEFKPVPSGSKRRLLHDYCFVSWLGSRVDAELWPFPRLSELQGIHHTLSTLIFVWRFKVQDGMDAYVQHVLCATEDVFVMRHRRQKEGPLPALSKLLPMPRLEEDCDVQGSRLRMLLALEFAACASTRSRSVAVRGEAVPENTAIQPQSTSLSSHELLAAALSFIGAKPLRNAQGNSMLIGHCQAGNERGCGFRMMVLVPGTCYAVIHRAEPGPARCLLRLRQLLERERLYMMPSWKRCAACISGRRHANLFGRASMTAA